MLKGRSRDPRVTSPAPAQQANRTQTQPAVARQLGVVPSSTKLTLRTPTAQRAPLAKPEPDYEVVEFSTEQYVNAKLQPPPPPPPRPPTGHPAEAGASCGLCGGGGARVRCAECGRRALCASCDDMYHRHPKRRHHQRQALSLSQLRDERPPLPPKTTPPVPPPRRHKISGDRTSASPRPPSADQRSPALGPTLLQTQNPAFSPNNHMTALPGQRAQVMPPHLQGKIGPAPAAHLGSMPYLPSTVHATPAQLQTTTLGHVPPAWGRPRASLPGFHVPPNMQMVTDTWDSAENGPAQGWGRPLRRGASVLELGGGMGMGIGGAVGMSGIGVGMGSSPCCGPWRYGSCASLDHQWGWPTCCPQSHPAQHHHMHAPFTPQPYRRDSRAMSRAASRACSRAASPAASTRSRTSRRARHRTPSPPPLPSSDADSESESDTEPRRPNHYPEKVKVLETQPEPNAEDSLGPAPEPPSSSWQCEHCTFVNEPGVRVCVICCRTPTTAPKVVDNSEEFKNSNRLEDSRNENTRSIDDSARAVAATARSIAHLDINDSVSSTSTSPVRSNGDFHVQNGVTLKSKLISSKERTSTGCGPSPPREVLRHKSFNRLVTPTREQNAEPVRSRHDMAVGPSPPKETQSSPPNTLDKDKTLVRASPYREMGSKETPMQHSVSVGSSPPRHNLNASISPSRNVQKKSTGTSPPRNNVTEIRSSSKAVRANVSNTGTSPPPQSISTQTYEVPSTWERPESRSRSRRRVREETRRERSHSRHSLSSDTRESDRGAAGRWEWRWGGDSSPGGEWSGSERRPPPRLARRASHLDLRRTRPPPRRDSFYGSEAASPEPTRAMSLEALAGQSAAAERGLELARLMTKAEQLGFSAAEVHAALAQRPSSPLRWLRERWAGLCAGVAAASARLDPAVRVSAREARAALARHRGAVWPAVTDCVRHHREQMAASGAIEASGTGRLTGRVWGSPAGAEDDAAPPRAGGSSDEAEHHRDWSLPKHRRRSDWPPDPWALPTGNAPDPDFDHLLSTNPEPSLLNLLAHENAIEPYIDSEKIHALELIQSENDFIEAYNALTRSTPLPGVEGQQKRATETDPRRDMYDNINDDALSNYNARNITTDQLIERLKEDMDYQLQNHKRISQNESPKTNTIGFAAEQPSTSSSKVKDQNTVSTTRILNNVEHSLVPTPRVVQNNKKIHSVRDNRNMRNKDYSQNQSNSAPHGKETQAVRNRINMSSERVNQEEEKGNNLNDIVDNTQKLIQQMKEEINSDINSIDSRQISQSEADSSSNESSDMSSEHESSYSESENDESEDVSSEGSKISGDGRNLPTSQPSGIERTSSEDNEQFEEAMDHIEDQIKDFKDTNIELLNSIARSLQEEHTISIAISESKDINIQNQDQNNNDFVEANSFEEIYAQINNKIDQRQLIVAKDITNNVSMNNNANISLDDNNSNNSNTDSTEIILKTKEPKYDIVTSTFIPVSPTKIFISETIQSYHKGVLETIEVYEEHEEEDIIPEQTMENINYDNKQIEKEGATDETAEEKAVIISQKSSQDSLNSILPSLSTDLNETSTILNNNQLPINENAINQINNPNNDASIANVIGMDELDSNQASAHNDNNEKSEHSVSEAVNENSTNKTSNSLKSNIPKLIKLASNNKQKDNKPATKIISSKVPIRRGSLKQYPAPAPPKAHFGHIQSGHVKQLQTRLFNNKFPKSSMNIPSTSIIPTPSTSTLGKKKPAPPPPIIEPKQSSPDKTSPVKEKKNNYFRESCRTEDEWSDSDSEDSQAQIVVKNTEPIRAPSPPPPVTVRRVSGQIIDLAKVQLPEGSPERQARMLLAQGATETWEQARLAVELAARGAEPAPALLAALDCADLPAALAYLRQECGLCAGHLPPHEMVSMLCCTHRCCRECARHYFTVQVSERSIADCVCPYCKEPELETMTEDAWLGYFAHLDILLKTLLDAEVHELFQRKLRDRTLALDPNFRWCVECSSGFFVHPKQKRVRCPECRNVSCAKCRKPWSTNHEGLTCEQYTAWLEDNDPERSMTAVQQHLKENGLECPRCHFKYSLSRGGCMHFTCTQCKFEFCYGCGKPFMMGARCGLSEYCAKLGLHAHHPRNCLFYLRDKEPHQLQTLLQMNDVAFETEAPEDSTNRCPIQLQRETPTGLIDGVCSSDVPPNHAGLCKNHYVEYLSRLVRGHGVDPLPLLDAEDLETLVRRAALRPPPRPYGSLGGLYRNSLIEVALRRIPGDARAQPRPHTCDGPRRPNSGAPPPRAASARAGPVGHRPHIRCHVRRDCERKNSIGLILGRMFATG